MIFLPKTPLKPNQISILFSSITTRFLSSTSNHHRRQHRYRPNPDPDSPTSASYDELITTAGRSKDFKTLHLLLNKRYKDGCFNTSNTFKFVTEEEVQENTNSTLLDQLTETLAHLDKGFARKNAFDSLISRLCKTNRINESQRIITKMNDNGYGVNSSTFHPLLNSLTRNRKFNEAWGIIKLMREKEIPIDIACYNYILSGYCVKGDLSAAAEVLSKIVEEEGIKEDPRTYDAIVMGACKVGKVEGALRVLRRMEEDGVPALYSTHVHVISGLMGLGFIKEAVEFVMAIGGKDDKGLNTENFGFLGSCLIKKRRVEEAKFVFGEMDKRGLKVGEKLRSEFESLLSFSSM